jgi:hypothetical protein
MPPPPTTLTELEAMDLAELEGDWTPQPPRRLMERGEGHLWTNGKRATTSETSEAQ